MKMLLAFMFVSVSALSSVSLASDSGEWNYTGSCMQTTTNDGSLPNTISIYEHQNGSEKILLKFYIGNDLRTVFATLTSRDAVNTLQYDDVRLFEDGAVKGGRIGIKFRVNQTVFISGGGLWWSYFDGSKASYICSRN
ncbi:hypothetical protein B9G69_010355 [Bdellovibrio sp. SKB1291214]|uniref:hypothetical protein n=1 Tax=Bdellovibrio sp. SKB1291214 TaxID=1732569 RepID=UPI000B518AA3|nr:hypothetical protein [Bdellovibrio sp. SKB1291214]UYL07445.1 hypothetical protein B9G69_010355 [Bdellovibrio sp. SKB1291214]